MEPEARYSLVGAVVLALGAALAAGVVWLAASGNQRDMRPYHVNFAKQSLEGLDVRSDVRMKGIRVGEVKSLAFSRDHAGTVEVVLAVEPTAPVLQSTRAVVDRNIVTGLASIRLVTLDDNSPALAPTGDDGVAVIAEGSSQFQQFSETVGELARRADVTLTRINETLSRENVAAISETLENVRVATRESTTRCAASTRTCQGRCRRRRLRETATGAGRDFHDLAVRYESLGDSADRSVLQMSASVDQLTSNVTALSRDAHEFLFDTGLELHATAQELRRPAARSAMRARAERPRAALLDRADRARPREERR
jgi:phospholipid/cholesterol/gamma-HCH transport system substrate-binding protein